MLHQQSSKFETQLTSEKENPMLGNPVVKGVIKSMQIDKVSSLASHIVSPREFDRLASQKLSPLADGETVRRSMFIVKPVCLEPPSSISPRFSKTKQQQLRKAYL